MCRLKKYNFKNILSFISECYIKSRNYKNDFVPAPVGWLHPECASRKFAIAMIESIEVHKCGEAYSIKKIIDAIDNIDGITDIERDKMYETCIRFFVVMNIGKRTAFASALSNSWYLIRKVINHIIFFTLFSSITLNIFRGDISLLLVILIFIAGILIFAPPILLAIGSEYRELDLIEKEIVFIKKAINDITNNDANNKIIEEVN